MSSNLADNVFLEEVKTENVTAAVTNCCSTAVGLFKVGCTGSVLQSCTWRGERPRDLAAGDIGCFELREIYFIVRRVTRSSSEYSNPSGVDPFYRSWAGVSYIYIYIRIQRSVHLVVSFGRNSGGEQQR